MHAGFHCAWKLHVWLLDLDIIRMLVSYKIAGKGSLRGVNGPSSSDIQNTCSLVTKLLFVKTKQNHIQFKCDMKMKPIFIVFAKG